MVVHITGLIQVLGDKTQLWESDYMLQLWTQTHAIAGKDSRPQEMKDAPYCTPLSQL